jgi:ATP-dependent exoDNAse (exonuclease V) beta subunit
VEERPVSRFQNRAISAAAGTGKTFRLAHRYIGLMAADVAPDRICALTFSRKAAGEIFDKIVEHLCAAATDGARRALTADTIEREGLTAPRDRPEAYVKLLRTLLDSGHRLRIGTLDSFILGIVRAFPMELGIPPETQPMDGDGGEAQAARQSILARLYDPTRRAEPTGHGAGGAFLADVRQARFGQETKTLATVLDTLITDYYGFFRQHGKTAWHRGAPDRIWPSAARWWERAGGPAAAIPGDLPEKLGAAFGPGARTQALGKACAVLATAARQHAADKPWPELNKTILPQLLEAAAKGLPPEILYYSKLYLVPDPLWPELRRALGNLIAVEANRSLERTRGLRTVLGRYDTLYAEALGTDGRFTFEDLSRLLGADGLRPSRAAAADNRLYIDYRLDGQLDHWMLDEFQDTSDTQWDALANLIDEVVQDENRSFFYVGDIKQSVYGWRGGNHRLFHAVLEKYKSLGPRSIAGESIARCRRSPPAILAAVNTVFGDLAGWTPAQGADKGLRRSAVEAFAAFWQTHESARMGEGEGYAALLEYAPKGKSGCAETEGDADEGAGDDPAEFAAVAAILKQVQPTRSELTTAVLVRSNPAGRACVDALRHLLPGVPVIHEGKGGIVDNPVVTLLLALVRYAAHPGDTAALRHLQMSPLADQSEVSAPDALPGVILASLQACGFAGTLREWGRRLGGLDDFGRQRLRELLAAAEQFDAAGSCDPDAFADHVEAYQVKSSAAAGTVRVMTIHQAKGLGFDLVIVPFAANARSFQKPGDPKLLAGDDWVLDPPCGQVLAVLDGAPLQALEAARADANFAQLCVLYVALTRAQRALYLLIPAKGKSSETVREADLLRERLATEGVSGEGPGGLVQCYAKGDGAWYKAAATPQRGVSPAASASPPAPVQVTYAGELTRREPSKEQVESRAFPARWLFSAEAGDVRAFGSAIHRLFQKIEWIEETDIDRLIAGWRAEASEPAALLDDVERQFRICLADGDVRRRLARPAGVPLAEVWREAPFELVLETGGGQQLTSGRFDRVVVERDAADRPIRATVFDFKSNRIETEEDMRKTAEGYAFQMDHYARAAACLLGLPPDQITSLLLFTRKGWIWTQGNAAKNGS